jgi:cytochrome c peroxidase
MRVAIRNLLICSSMFAPIGPALAQIPPLGSAPVPAGNPQTAAKIALGQTLFWDEQLSLTGTVACGTCHRGQSAGSDPRSAIVGTHATHPGPDGVTGNADDIVASPGVPAHDGDGNYLLSTRFGLRPQVGGRKANSAINAAFSPVLFWDGRAGGQFRDPLTNQILLNNGAALENQALAPLLDGSEMGHSGVQLTTISSRLVTTKPLALAQDVPAALDTWIAGRSYPALFAEVFGTAEVTPARLAFAIASYQRTLVSNQTPIDSERGGTPSLTQLERQGQQIFLANDCGICHGGALFSDNQFHYIGVRPISDDAGRFVQSADPADFGAMRTPSLRGVGQRAPYMHNGRFAALEDVVEFYNRGGDFNAPNKSPLVRPRGLSAGQKTALLAFLRRPLSDLRVMAELSPFDRPTLYSESDRVPQISGAGRAGSALQVPQITALEPPLLGSSNFTLVISQALAGAAVDMVVGSSDPGFQSSLPVGDFANLTGTLDSNGISSMQLSLPVGQAAAGQTLFVRAYVLDPQAVNGYAVTPLLSFRIFGEDSDRIFVGSFE